MIFEFSWNKNLFQKLLTFEKNPKVIKFYEKKLSRKRWPAINFLTPLFSKVIKVKLSETRPFNRFLRLTFGTNISFQNSNTQTSFLKANYNRTRKLRKLTSTIKTFTLVIKALQHLPQILFCLLTTPYPHGNVVVQKKGY